MPGKMARSDPRPSFGLPDLLVAIHTSRQSCSKAGKAQMFALVWESSGESRFSSLIPGFCGVGGGALGQTVVCNPGPERSAERRDEPAVFRLQCDPAVAIAAGQRHGS